MKVKFKNWDCTTSWGRYGNNNLALQLFDADPEGFGEPVATATVNLWDPPPPDKMWNKETQVWIKDWSENKGMYHALVTAGVIESTEQIWPAGYVQARLGTLTEAALNELKQARGV